MDSNLLGITGWTVWSVDNSNCVCKIRATLEHTRPKQCPKCNGARIISASKRTQKITDIPRGGKQVVVLLGRHCYRCHACRHVFTAPVPELPFRCQITTRLTKYIQDQCADRTMISVAKEVGLNITTIRTICRKARLATSAQQ